MPRGARLDATGTMHHVMARGIERCRIFRNDADRADFVARLSAQVEATGVSVHAWALLPNHLHLLVQTGRRPLPTVMRRLLTGYAVAFNRRHRRHGHLFQNRYRSIVVEADAYGRELIRYLHLNPLRAGVVASLAALDRYPWAGHGALVGRIACPWQAVAPVLALFAPTRGTARRRYRAFVAEGIVQGRRPDLMGGGLRRSAGGWQGVAALRRGRERWAADERILGGSDFVERMRREVQSAASAWPRAKARTRLPGVLVRIAHTFGVQEAELVGGSRRVAAVHARAAVSAVAVGHLGLPGAEVARVLGVSPSAVSRGVQAGAKLLARRGLDPNRLIAR